MTKIRFIFIFIITLTVSCGAPNNEDQHQDNQKDITNNGNVISVEKIIDESYKRHGCDRINSASVSFDFRSTHFEYNNTDSGLVRSRAFIDSSGNKIKDVWSENTLNRFKNHTPVALSSSKQAAYKNTINSVFYFAFLPRSLKDPAVNLEYLDSVIISKKAYHKIRVTFDEEGGGEDHEDVFIYWINKENFTLDYLAYSYLENGGGMRFRAFTNRREVAGVVFQDYKNYKAMDGSLLIEFDSLYNNDQLILVSLIEQMNIVVD